MSAKKEVYLLVKKLIKEITEIKHFDVWNDNTERDGEVTSFPVPAVFFEWSSTVWMPSTKGSTNNLDDTIPNQHGDLQFTLHQVSKKTNVEEQDELSQYDIEQLIYEKIHFKTFDDPDVDFIEGKIQRFGEETIIRHKVWRDVPVIYSVEVIECGKTGIGDTLEDAQPVDFEVEPELVIKNIEGQQGGKLFIEISD